MLNDEALNSSYQWHYFPIRIGDCVHAHRTLFRSIYFQYDWLDEFIPTVDAVVTPVDPAVFDSMTHLRGDLANLSKCLLSYKKQLDNFEVWLYSLTPSALNADFNYEPPTTWLPKFTMDGQWLESISSQYIANSLSKLELATDLHANGSEVLTTADRLYADIEQSLFVKASNLIDEQEAGMVSFYDGLMQRFTSLQRYMFDNDTSLEEFMRHVSIWRMPVVNFQKSQVLLLPLVIYNCVFS